jgi:hypothetical protein
VRDLVRPLLRTRSAKDEIVVVPSGPSVYDSLTTAMCKMKNSPNLHQAIVLVAGENDSLPNPLRVDELTRAAQYASAQIFLVLPFEPEERKKLPEANLQRIATQSGGDVYFVSSEPELQRALGRIILLLRSQYAFACYPENVERFRRIEVKTSRAGAFAVLLGSRPVGYLYEGMGDLICPAPSLN